MPDLNMLSGDGVQALPFAALKESILLKLEKAAADDMQRQLDHYLEECSTCTCTEEMARKAGSLLHQLETTYKAALVAAKAIKDYKG